MKSWNNNPKVNHKSQIQLDSPNDRLPRGSDSLLVFGNGRSYGDVCLNEGGVLLLSKSLNRMVMFDESSGRLTCESGVLLKDILDVCVPKGWFLPVVPGTQYVTVGGAIANDVHGKNHTAEGTFGHHVLQFELLRSDGERKVCSLTSHPDWFKATIGGLGLTGVITWAELQLQPVPSSYVRCQTKRFGNIDEYWDMNLTALQEWHYNVAWIDCLAKGRAIGRGLLTSANHSLSPGGRAPWRERELCFPLTPPVSLVNLPSLKAFNTFYYYKPISPGVVFQHYAPYFFPLDGIRDWNRMYGKKGFYQYQCVVPKLVEKEAIKALLKVISQYQDGSFLAVLKSFGNKTSAGLLSFPKEGSTLALDFPNRGSRTLKLLRALDDVVKDAGGALYPAKDARMSGSLFRDSFPNYEIFQSFIDPRFCSSFWRRITR